MTLSPLKTFALALALSASVAVPSALAHSKQETTEPADGAVVEAVERIVLRFDQPMRVTRIVLAGEGGEIALVSEMGTDAVTEYVATLDDALPLEALAPGDYTVEWRGLAADGHPMQGGHAFTVAP